MSSFGEDHRGVSVAPVVQALMDDLVARGAVRAGDVERAWNGRVPANSNEALALLETSGLITATQVGLLRSAFEERQRQNLGAVLAGAKTAGIVSDDGATVAVLGFEVDRTTWHSASRAPRRNGRECRPGLPRRRFHER